MTIVESNLHENIKTNHRATIMSINNQVKTLGAGILFYTLGYVSMNYNFQSTYLLTSIGIIALLFILFLLFYFRKLLTKNENKQYL